MQAKESTVVSDEILHDVMEVLRRQRVDPERVSPKVVREALKTLKYRKCYEVRFDCFLSPLSEPRFFDRH